MVYGLLIDNELYYLKQITSPKKFNEILETFHMKDGENIQMDKLYPENLWSKIGRRASQNLGIEEAEFYQGVGRSFIKFVKTYQFDKLMSVIGRRFRDFVMNLDNVHHYLKNKFTGMKAPSFFVESETPQGLTLVYRSKRRGYSYYTIGQMKEISKVYFRLDLQMKLIKQEIQFDTVFVKYE